MPGTPETGRMAKSAGALGPGRRPAYAPGNPGPPGTGQTTVEEL